VQVVTLEGLRQISNAFASERQPWPWPLQPLLEVMEVLAPLFCIGVAWVWITAPIPSIPSRAPARVIGFRPWRQAGSIGTVETAAVGCVFFAVLSLVFSFELRKIDHDNPLFFWILPCAAIGAWRLAACSRLLRQTRGSTRRFKSRRAFAPTTLAAGAVLLAATPWWWQHVATNAGFNDLQASSSDLVDQNALINLALDPDAGLALCVSDLGNGGGHRA
jgi:hypothetical protein